MPQHNVKLYDLRFLCRYVCSVSKLVRVKGGRQVSLAMIYDQLLQELDDDACECSWPVVLMANRVRLMVNVLTLLTCPCGTFYTATQILFDQNNQ